MLILILQCNGQRLLELSTMRAFFSYLSLGGGGGWGGGDKTKVAKNNIKPMTNLIQISPPKKEKKKVFQLWYQYDIIVLHLTLETETSLCFK